MNFRHIYTFGKLLLTVFAEFFGPNLKNPDVGPDK